LPFEFGCWGTHFFDRTNYLFSIFIPLFFDLDINIVSLLIKNKNNVTLIVVTFVIFIDKPKFGNFFKPLEKKTKKMLIK